jgi:23S rRNA (uracil1939-C5)-methyltransferase
MIKNDIYEVQIVDMTEEGEGIGKADGFTLFIKDAVIGDKVRCKVMKAKKNYGYGKLLEVITPSPNRVEPKCPVAGPCGGCKLQAMSYESQLAFKKNKVENLLKRVGGFPNPPVRPVMGMEEPYGYRNKAQFPVGRNKEGKLVTGFYAGRTHSIIETPHCYLGDDVNHQVMQLVLEWMEVFHIEPYEETTHKGLIRHVLIRTGEHTAKSEAHRQIMVCLVINGGKLPHSEELKERLLTIPGMTAISYNINREKTNVILGAQVHTLYGPGYITDTIGDLRYRISPQSFFQVNPTQTEILYETALKFAGLTGKENVWDLYCGTGTITLFLAKQAKMVRGVEIIPAAIADARENARANGIANAEFYVGKAEEVLPGYFEKTKEPADVIVVDPPRGGCEETLLRTMLQMKPEKIVYVSCGVASLARDLKILCETDYELVEVQPVDMFPQTVGIENVCLLRRRETTEERE